MSWGPGRNNITNMEKLSIKSYTIGPSETCVVAEISILDRDKKTNLHGLDR
jgi:hypothetical protein